MGMNQIMLVLGVWAAGVRAFFERDQQGQSASFRNDSFRTRSRKLTATHRQDSRSRPGTWNDWMQNNFPNDSEDGPDSQAQSQHDAGDLVPDDFLHIGLLSAPIHQADYLGHTGPCMDLLEQQSTDICHDLDETAFLPSIGDEVDAGDHTAVIELNVDVGKSADVGRESESDSLDATLCVETNRVPVVGLANVDEADPISASPVHHEESNEGEMLDLVGRGGSSETKDDHLEENNSDILVTLRSCAIEKDTPGEFQQIERIQCNAIQLNEFRSSNAADMNIAVDSERSIAILQAHIIAQDTEPEGIVAPLDFNQECLSSQAETSSVSNLDCVRYSSSDGDDQQPDRLFTINKRYERLISQILARVPEKTVRHPILQNSQQLSTYTFHHFIRALWRHIRTALRCSLPQLLDIHTDLNNVILRLLAQADCRYHEMSPEDLIEIMQLSWYPPNNEFNGDNQLDGQDHDNIQREAHAQPSAQGVTELESNQFHPLSVYEEDVDIAGVVHVLPEVVAVMEPDVINVSGCIPILNVLIEWLSERCS